MPPEEHDAAHEESAPALVIPTEAFTAGLLAAAKLGRCALVQRCIELGGDASAADARGWTPLHYASFYGHHAIVEALILAGAAEPFRHDDFSGVVGGGIGSATSGGNSSPIPAGTTAAVAPTRPNTRILHSPLHAAVSRGHLRCVWALLSAGVSPLDCDNCGHNALHLAAACATSSPRVRYEMLTTIMAAGFDPHAKNWLGHSAADMLPPGSANVRSAELLASAAATLICPSTGVAFRGFEQPRFLCASSLRFFSEAASVAASVHAFAPAIRGVTAVAPATAANASSGGGLDEDEDEEGDGGVRGGAARREDAGEEEFAGPSIKGAVASISPAAAGFVIGAAGLPLALWPGDEAIMRPIRLGADASYRFADTEAALFAAMAPFSNSGGGGDLNATLSSPLAGAHDSLILEDDAGAVPAESSVPAAAAVVSTPAKTRGAGARSTAVTSADSVAAVGLALGSPQSPARGGGGGGGTARSRAWGSDGGETAGGGGSPRRMLDVPDEGALAFPIELHALDTHVTALDAAIAAARDGRCDAQAIARALSMRHRLRLAARVRSAASDVAAARPLTTRLDPNLLRLHAATARASRAGASAVFVSLATLSAALAEAELDVRNAHDVASRISLASHAHDAAIARLDAALQRSQALHRLAVTAASGEVSDAASPAQILTAGEEDLTAEGGVKDAVVAAAVNDTAPTKDSHGEPAREGVEGAVVLAEESAPVPPLCESASLILAAGIAPSPRWCISPVAALLPACPSVAPTLLSTASALLRRLQAEVCVADLLSAAEAAMAEASAIAAVIEPADVDPSTLPVPEPPPGWVPPIPEPPPVAIPVKGGKAPPAKAAPAPPKSGKGAAPPPEEPPPHPPVDTIFPHDDKGVPLPHTRQLLSLLGLRDALARVEHAALAGAAAGADAVCVTAAVTAVVRFKEALAAGLLAESLRVTAARAAAAKKKNKGRGASPTKKK